MDTCAQCGTEVVGPVCSHCRAGIEPSRPTRRVVRRPSPSPFLARVGAPIGEGSTVILARGDGFYGVRHGACALALVDPGEHALDEELDDGWFVEGDGIALELDEPFGALDDNHGHRALVRASGTARLRLDEPRDFVAALSSTGALVDLPALVSRVRRKLGELVEAEVRGLLAKDHWFSALQSTQTLDAIRAAVPETWAGDAERDAFTKVELVRLQIEVGPVERASADGLDAPRSSSPRRSQVGPGARIEVALPDGRRSSGIVRASGYLVTFDDGHERWVTTEAVAT